MNQIYAIWTNSDRNTCSLVYKEKLYSKEEINQKIDLFVKNLSGLFDVDNRKIYVDIQDRLLFFVTVLALLKLETKIVLVPVEMKKEDYLTGGAYFITDNKTYEGSFFLNEDLSITVPGGLKAVKEVTAVDEVHAGEKEDPYVIYFYTSSSTGKAKLIGKRTENLVVELEELQTFLQTTENDHFFSTTPLYHIYGFLFAFLLPLYTSCKNTITPYFTPSSISEAVKNRGVTCFISSPAYYDKLSYLNHMEHFPPSVHCISSSAPLSLEVSKSFYEKNVKIREIYGSTETGGIAYRVSAEDIKWKLFSYVHIKNSRSDSTEYQELCIDSKAVSVEYDSRTGYNTGDLVEFFENSFVLQGRNSRFVKIGGKRVDLNNVRTKFGEYSSISRDEALYVGEYRGKLFVISEEKFPASTADMKKDLAEYLPAYGIPRIFIQAQIPKNSLGKIIKNEIEEMVKNVLN